MCKHLAILRQPFWYTGMATSNFWALGSSYLYSGPRTFSRSPRALALTRKQ